MQGVFFSSIIIQLSTGICKLKFTAMSQQLTEEEKHKLEDRLFELRQEHRDLDDVIDRMLLSPDVEELQLKRFKKRKLLLKDSILKLENALIPDILA